MEAEDPLSQLADIHLPAAVPFWPPAPGWWLLAALLLLGLGLLLWARFRIWQQQQRLQAALRELQRARQTWSESSATDSNAAGLALLQALNSLLKRVALLHFPATEVASLTGQRWLQFLDAQGSGQNFSNGVGRALAEGEYRRTFDADGAALCSLVQDWISTQYQRQQSASRAAVAGKGSEVKA